MRWWRSQNRLRPDDHASMITRATTCPRCGRLVHRPSILQRLLSEKGQLAIFGGSADCKNCTCNPNPCQSCSGPQNNATIVFSDGSPPVILSGQLGVNTFSEAGGGCSWVWAGITGHDLQINYCLADKQYDSGFFASHDNNVYGVNPPHICNGLRLGGSIVPSGISCVSGKLVAGYTLFNITGNGSYVTITI